VIDLGPVSRLTGVLVLVYLSYVCLSLHEFRSTSVFTTLSTSPKKKKKKKGKVFDIVLYNTYNTVHAVLHKSHHEGLWISLSVCTNSRLQTGENKQRVAQACLGMRGYLIEVRYLVTFPLAFKNLMVYKIATYLYD